jgi:hypothetical protein
MADRYWVGGTGTWDATSTTNWATSSGGAGGASAPTSADNVIFDANSNTLLLPFTVTVGGDSTTPSVCNDFTTGGAGGALDGVMTLSMGTNSNLDIYGSMTLPASNLTWSGTNATTCSLSFKATTTGKTITTNGVTLTLQRVILRGNGGAWTLGSAFTNTGTAFFIQEGTFNTGNYNMTVVSLQRTDGSVIASINLGSSTITASAAAGILIEPTNLTFNAGTSQITCSAATPTFAGNGLTYYNVSFTSAVNGTTTINGANTFNNLTQTSRGATGRRGVVLGANQTISGALTLGAANTSIRRIQLFSDTVGTQRTITCNGTLAALADVDFRDINAAGTVATPWTGTRIGNCLGNSNITFTAAADKYWNLAAGGSWSATAWALSSGGGVAANNFPLAQDKVIIENTGLNTSATITIDLIWMIGEIDISTRSNAMTLASGTISTSFYKNITLSSAVTMTGTGGWNINGQGTTQILDVNTATFVPPITINIPTGTFQLAENTTCSATVTLTQGTLDLNDFDLTCNIFSSSNSNTRVIDFGTGEINVTGNNATIFSMGTSTNFTYTGTPTLNFTYSGGTGTRGIAPPDTTLGGVESNALNYNISAGTDIINTFSNRTFKNLNFTGFTGTLTNTSRTIFGNLTISSGMTLTDGTSITTFAATSGTQTITSNDKTLDFPVTINGVGGTFQMADALTLGSTRTLTLNAGTVKFKDGTTNSAGTFVIQGSSGNQVVLNSTSNGNQYTLSQSTGTVVAEFATIKDTIGAGGATYVANLDTNINGGNNTNWLFILDIVVEVSSPTNTGWGANSWNEGNFGGIISLNINLQNVSIVTTSSVIANVTGEELVHTLESNVGISAGGSVQIPVFENPLITTLNSVTVVATENITVSVTGQNLTTALNSVTALGTANVSLTGENLTTALGDEAVAIGVNVSLTGQNLTTALNSVNVAIFADAFVNVTGEQLTTTLSSVSIDLNTPIDLTGQNLTLTLGDETAFTSITVNLIGQNLTGATGQLYVTAWANVNTGQSVNYTGVNTGQNVNYTDVNTGQTITWTDVAA